MRRSDARCESIPEAHWSIAAAKRMNCKWSSGAEWLRNLAIWKGYNYYNFFNESLCIHIFPIHMKCAMYSAMTFSRSHLFDAECTLGNVQVMAVVALNCKTSFMHGCQRVFSWSHDTSSSFHSDWSQGCQHWMRVWSEKCEGRPLPAYKVAQVPKKSWWAGGGGGGDSDTFFFSTSKFLPRFCRHIEGVPFVHHKPLTSKK